MSPFKETMNKEDKDGEEEQVEETQSRSEDLLEAGQAETQSRSEEKKAKWRLCLLAERLEEESNGWVSMNQWQPVPVLKSEVNIATETDPLFFDDEVPLAVCAKLFVERTLADTIGVFVGSEAIRSVQAQNKAERGLPCDCTYETLHYFCTQEYYFCTQASHCTLADLQSAGYEKEYRPDFRAFAKTVKKIRYAAEERGTQKRENIRLVYWLHSDSTNVSSTDSLSALSAAAYSELVYLSDADRDALLAADSNPVSLAIASDGNPVFLSTASDSLHWEDAIRQEETRVYGCFNSLAGLKQYGSDDDEGEEKEGREVFKMETRPVEDMIEIKRGEEEVLETDEAEEAEQEDADCEDMPPLVSYESAVRPVWPPSLFCPEIFADTQHPKKEGEGSTKTEEEGDEKELSSWPESLARLIDFLAESIEGEDDVAEKGEEEERMPLLGNYYDSGEPFNQVFSEVEDDDDKKEGKEDEREEERGDGTNEEREEGECSDQESESETSEYIPLRPSRPPPPLPSSKLSDSASSSSYSSESSPSSASSDSSNEYTYETDSDEESDSEESQGPLPNPPKDEEESSESASYTYSYSAGDDEESESEESEEDEEDGDSESGEEESGSDEYTYETDSSSSSSSHSYDSIHGRSSSGSESSDDEESEKGEEDEKEEKGWIERDVIKEFREKEMLQKIREPIADKEEQQQKGGHIVIDIPSCDPSDSDINCECFSSNKKSNGFEFSTTNYTQTRQVEERRVTYDEQSINERSGAEQSINERSEAERSYYNKMIRNISIELLEQSSKQLEPQFVNSDWHHLAALSGKCTFLVVGSNKEQRDGFYRWFTDNNMAFEAVPDIDGSPMPLETCLQMVRDIERADVFGCCKALVRVSDTRSCTSTLARFLRQRTNAAVMIDLTQGLSRYVPFIGEPVSFVVLTASAPLGDFRYAFNQMAGKFAYGAEELRNLFDRWDISSPISVLHTVESTDLVLVPVDSNLEHSGFYRPWLLRGAARQK